ncbi:MAG: MBL fold hydrolase [Candidatus Hydrogenedentota bacterium]
MITPDKNYIRFLGTAGSRWVVARQTRASGGIFMHMNGQNILMDPGPGSLVRCAQCDPPIDPAALNAVILTHGHIDHCNDVNIVIDAMTAGGFSRGGLLFAPQSCLQGEHAVVMRYLCPFLDAITPIEAKCEYHFHGISFQASQAHHHGIETYGLIFDTGSTKIGFLVDTRYFPELSQSYLGADILVINVTFFEPPPHPRILHLSVEDSMEILREVRPGKAILSHFGMSMLEAVPADVAKRMSDELGIDVVAAEDGMLVEIN